MVYKETIHLPQTEFAMKAGLTQREPKFLKRWEGKNLYRLILEKGKKGKKFLLHDGPPYANGNIHLGHVMNKTLKDIVIKSRTMLGFLSPYVPGWDCHGLPIEHQVVKKLGAKARELSPADLRRECRKYAESFIDIQRNEFKRLGVFGDWENPYRTMDYAYQANIAREFGKVVEKGYVFRQRKPVHWCFTCRTALAEAEIEYEDHTSPSIYVSYPIASGWDEAGLPKTPEGERFAVIWTTTPWTLPASMAIAYNENVSYVVVEKKREKGRYILAEALLPAVGASLGKGGALQVVAKIEKGKSLAKLKANHPFLKREIPFLAGTHVTMETGTGLVHTAPGHGEEDYDLGITNGIEVYSPVMADGRFEPSVEKFGGMKIFDANPKIIDHLLGSGRLFAPAGSVTHSYPHCWRCKNPVIFRATEQWFLSMSHHELRTKSLKEIDRVRWVPQWGKERIYGMISNRPDWCLSRQRLWGVPIIVFECTNCHELLLSSDVIQHVANLFEKEGADVWFEKEAVELLPSGTKCSKCKGKAFEKGKDILDVWFDSGASHAAVLAARKELAWPADAYLEGSDQHRGWFHSTLLEGVATRGRSPYDSVITHGFVVDGQGKKMSKSLGNYVSAQELISQHGAEMLRLWVATEDYRNDVRYSKEIFDRVVESYRRIRNTARYCLGNCFDFSPDRDRVPSEKWPRDIDRFAAERLSRLIERVRDAYEKLEFHVVIQAINEFCVIEMSSLYLDVSKDVLYCDQASGVRRRSAQTILFDTAAALAKMLAPILPFTAEDIWDHLPAFKNKSLSVHLADLPEAMYKEDQGLDERWTMLLSVRSEVSKVLERLRKEKKIGQSLEARVEIVAPPEIKSLLSNLGTELLLLFIVSRVSIVDRLSSGLEEMSSEIIPGLKVGAEPIGGKRCERCWTYANDIGAVKEHPALCKRCGEVILMWEKK